MSPSDEEPISLIHWLIVGGTGTPPTRSILLRKASERKAAHRREQADAQAKKDATAKLEVEHGTFGFNGFMKRKLGLEKKKKPKADKLMDKHGGKEKAIGLRRNARTSGGAVADVVTGDQPPVGNTSSSSQPPDFSDADKGNQAQPKGANPAPLR